METYIQVAGLGDVIETVVEQRATVTITVKASKTEVALSEATGLRNDAIRILQDAGLKPDEIREGGRDTWQPWYSRRGVGQEAAHRVLLACRETRRLYRALDALEPLFTNSRYTLNVDMQQPRFEAQEGAEAEARMTAIRHARDKALLLAKEAGVTLGAVAQVEELGSQADNTGAYGDYTWALGGAAAAMAAPANEFEELAGATRVRTLRYRIRFLIG
ncbi:SIMPL domain-containing protein [Variovorax sp. E3]|uniref:SIMPL domain-containing protein n=1 Tax=Variovorax sp. E3 TaxID=1914993 RepID=UPI0018DE5AD7|nr:SIMPL domain-containing protein [Variovorax sp. E3]